MLWSLCCRACAVKKRVKEAESLCSQLSLSFHAPLPSLVYSGCTVKRHRAGGGGGVLHSFHWYRFGTNSSKMGLTSSFIYLLTPSTSLLHLLTFPANTRLQMRACGEQIRQAEPGAEGTDWERRKEERGGRILGPDMLLHMEILSDLTRFLSSRIITTSKVRPAQRSERAERRGF